MKTLEQRKFRCEFDRKNLTDKVHIRILLPFTSGMMMPPFIGGRPEVSFSEGNPVLHFCPNEMCLPAWFKNQIHVANTARSERKNTSNAVSRKVLTPVSLERSRVRREADMGTRSEVRGEESAGVAGAIRGVFIARVKVAHSLRYVAGEGIRLRPIKTCSRWVLDSKIKTRQKTFSGIREKGHADTL